MDVATMLAELDANGFTDEDTNSKVRVLQGAIWGLEGREAWPFIETTAALTFDGTSNTASNMPTDWRATVRITMADGTRLMPKRIEELEDIAYGNYVGTGSPLYYYDWAATLSLYPRPTSGNTATMRYLKWSPAITSSSLESDILIPKYYHELIIFSSLITLYDREDDTELAVRFESRLENGLARMREALWKRQYDMPDRIQMLHNDY